MTPTTNRKPPTLLTFMLGNYSCNSNCFPNSKSQTQDSNPWSLERRAEPIYSSVEVVIHCRIVAYSPNRKNHQNTIKKSGDHGINYTFSFFWRFLESPFDQNIQLIVVNIGQNNELCGKPLYIQLSKTFGFS